jgi:hypothetical protein
VTAPMPVAAGPKPPAPPARKAAKAAPTRMTYVAPCGTVLDLRDVIGACPLTTADLGASTFYIVLTSAGHEVRMAADEAARQAFINAWHAVAHYGE